MASIKPGLSKKTTGLRDAQLLRSVHVNNLGPISHAHIEFGDLTLFVGPQGSGKSILLQLVKLLADKGHIRRTLENYGFVWGPDLKGILETYFGEGMSGIWSSKTSITFNGSSISSSDIIPSKGRKGSTMGAVESLFYVPAQRVVCLENGWPRFFTSYDYSVPFVLRDFSESIRQLLEGGLAKKKDAIFPASQRLKDPLRKAFAQHIFHNGNIEVDRSTSRKQFKMKVEGNSIPFMAWSAGQKEFMPLLLSFYYLCPPSATSMKDSVKTVILEEPEMGLHPSAIESVILQVIELLARGYQVIVSTHSPVFLEYAWAFQLLKNWKQPDKKLLELFNLGVNAATQQLVKGSMDKSVKTYYFDLDKGQSVVRDISELDPGDAETAISEWGGLSSFASRVAEIVAKTASQNA